MKYKRRVLLIALFVILLSGVIHVNAATIVSSDSSKKIKAEYSDDYFYQSAEKESDYLAKLSLVASDAAYKDTDAFLESCGFRNVRTETIVKNADPMEKTLPHPIKVTFGYKNIASYDLYAIVVRGTVGASEWVSNFDLSSLEMNRANQFVIPAKNIMSSFNKYKEKYYTSKSKTKVWVTGHSRGGAVANILGHQLNKKYLASNIYAYTFAGAKVMKGNVNDTNIFNYIIKEDVVPKVPPGYKRYGKDIVLSTSGYMNRLYRLMTLKEYKGTMVQAHSLEAYMCALCNTKTFPEDNAKISINIKKKNLYPGEKIKLKPVVYGKSKKVIWASDNTKVAAVSMSGQVNAKSPGKATITAKANGKTAKCVITVKKLTKKAQHKLYESTIKSYSKSMKKGAKKWNEDAGLNTYFAFVDIDKNGTDEVIVRVASSYGKHTTANTSGYGENTHIYTIKNNKVKKVLGNRTYAPTLQHDYYVHVYKNCKYIDRGFSHLPSDYIFYKYKNGTLSSKPTYRFAVGGWGAGTWIVNGKNVSRKECMKQLNKISGKREGYPMHKYSSSTYKKYI